MKHTIPHGLDHDLARKATNKALASYVDQLGEYDATVSWAGDRATVQFTMMRKKLDAHVEVQPKDILIEFTVPFMFKAFEKQAVQIVEREVMVWIDKARNGSLV